MQQGVAIQPQEGHGILFSGSVSNKLTVSVLAVLAGALTIGGALGTNPPTGGTVTGGQTWTLTAGTGPGLYELPIQSSGAFSYSFAVSADAANVLMGVF